MKKEEELAKIRGALRDLLPRCQEQYKVESMAVFGSFVRHEQKQGSDFDILVTFREAPTLFEFVRLENFLSESLGLRVDLVMKDVLKPGLRERILEDSVPI
jgi:uncharacterized protein